MGIYLNPGYELFQMDIHSQIYVDKTELIKYTNQFIGTQQRYLCISRPRRFGKTMAASMLCAYYEKDWDADFLFEKFKIAKEKSYKEHLNQYHVIALNIQNFISICPKIQDALDLLQAEVIEDLRERFPEIVTEKIKYMSLALNKIYSKTRESFIFIIDEWDCLFRDNRFTEADQKVYLDFIRNLFKDQIYVKLVYMTGILPVKKYGSHSALNMFAEYSMIEPGIFKPFIGFTEEEVHSLCSRYEVDYEKLKYWYDGYVFSEDYHIYNPKSVVDSILWKKFSSYWTQTETYEALRVHIALNYEGLQDAIIKMLSGEKIQIDSQTFQNDMVTFHGRDDVLSLLVHLGYLAFEEESSSVFIPNAEVGAEFVRSVKFCGWNKTLYINEKFSNIYESENL